MAFARIGILSIGEMGYHWAKILTGRGVEVLTYAKDRSETTRKRAENVGVKCVPSIATLVKDADLIVSIVVPSGGETRGDQSCQQRRPSRDAGIFFI
jgi:3-hydroxyisobutyrate dehydrogenase-like beta-hydroxyacid dehydrogenase